MKTILISLFIFSFPLLIKSQPPFPSDEEIEQFMTSKTCIVLEEDLFSSYNIAIKEAVEEYWTITPYEFINVKDFNVKRRDISYSFIVLTETNFEKDKSASVYNFINLLQGKNVSKLGEMPEICAVPLSYAGESDLEYSYKLGAILLFIQKHAEMISDNPSFTARRSLKYYNSNIPEVSKKTILIDKKDLAPEISTITKIKAIYPYSIKIVPEDSIVNAIRERKSNTIILHKIGPPEGMKGYCFKMLIGTDNAEMYYYNRHSIDKANPNGFLPGDLKRLSR